MFKEVFKKLILFLSALLATMTNLGAPTMTQAAGDPRLTISSNRFYYDECQPVAAGKEINGHSVQTADGNSLPYLLAQYPRLDYPITLCANVTETPPLC